MLEQGYPLYAQRVSDGTVWLVVGWQPAGDGLIPVMVPGDDANTGRACMQSGARFVFSVERPSGRSVPDPDGDAYELEKLRDAYVMVERSRNLWKQRAEAYESDSARTKPAEDGLSQFVAREHGPHPYVPQSHKGRRIDACAHFTQVSSHEATQCGAGVGDPIHQGVLDAGR